METKIRWSEVKLQKKWYIKGVDKSKITMDNYNTDVRVDKLNHFWILIGVGKK